jgi:hypothetical protein
VYKRLGRGFEKPPVADALLLAGKRSTAG